MRRLCLDISKAGTGHAGRDATSIIRSGVKSFDHCKTPGETLVAFDRWLGERMHGVDELIVERPWQSAVRPNPLLTKLVGVAEMHAHRAGVPFRQTSPKSVKKAITGSGDADKQDMIDALSAYVGRPMRDDNEADAIGILLAAEAGKLDAEKKPKKRKSTKCKTQPEPDLFTSSSPTPRARRRKRT